MMKKADAGATAGCEVMRREYDSLHSPRKTRAQILATLAGVLVPPLGLIVAVCRVWGWGFGWVELTLLLAMYVATGLGITVGFHRHFAHRSFETLRPIRGALGVLGSMSVQGPLLRWVAVHRRHHQHSDQPEDPHSPHRFGGGFRGVVAGWWHAHIGWMFTSNRVVSDRYVRDLLGDKLVCRISRLFPLWVAIGLLIPTVLGGVLTGTWTGAFLGFLWGGLVRVFLGHHVTWSINSICHLWGRRRFQSHDESRNNFLCGVLALGEGWHNNHHAFPGSARHGLAWWELDVSYLVIRGLKLFGLARHVRVPTSGAIATARRREAPLPSTSRPTDTLHPLGSLRSHHASRRAVNTSSRYNGGGTPAI